LKIDSKVATLARIEIEQTIHRNQTIAFHASIDIKDTGDRWHSTDVMQPCAV